MSDITQGNTYDNQEQHVVDEIARTRLIAILRGDLRGKALNIAEILLASGIRVLEVTMNSPNALDVISNIRQNVGTSFVLGAGTVLRRDEVKMAFDSGAHFIVSPNMSPSVIQATKDLGMASFPGCSTCTEILEGFRHGADGVKLFPAAAIPPESLRAVRASLGDLRLIPTGGITEVNAGQYFAAGAWALGIGSALVNAHKLDSMGETELRRRATAFVAAAAAAQQVQK